MWRSPYLGPAQNEYTSAHEETTLATATSSVRPTVRVVLTGCAPGRRAPDALAQIPAPCSGALALRPSGPGPRLPESPTRLGTSLPPRHPAAGWRPRRSGPTGRRRGRRWRRWSATSSRTRSPGASRGCCSRGASARATSPPRRCSCSSSSTSSTVSASIDQMLRLVSLSRK